MNASVTAYTELIPSSNQDAPNFMAMVAATAQPWADCSAVYQSIPELYDIDNAVGTQLDTLGQWIGVSRNLAEPLTGVYFALDTTGVGFDQGVWQGPYDPSTGLVALPDQFYVLLLKAKILNNYWNGTKPTAYALADVLYAAFGYSLMIQDNANLTMDIGLFGPGTPPPIVTAMLSQGLLDIKPATIAIAEYFYQSAPGPMFGFDIENSYFAGFDTGSWATITT